MAKAVVVFRAEGDRWFSRFLKPGYRHVFCLIDEGDFWVLIDGLVGVPVIQAAAESAFDVAGWYRGQGFTVIETEKRDTAPRLPFVAANCVGMVKVALGIRAPFAVTPHQLYRALKRREHGQQRTGPRSPWWSRRRQRKVPS